MYYTSLVDRERGRAAEAQSTALQALRRVEEGLRAEPDHGVLKVLQGYLYDFLGDASRAERLLADVAKWDPGYHSNFKFMLWTDGEQEALETGRF